MVKAVPCINAELPSAPKELSSSGSVRRINRFHVTEYLTLPFLPHTESIMTIHHIGE
jgi:hypothetical protein